MKAAGFPLLKAWCDKLLELQLAAPDDQRTNGGILCPACLDFHGRSWEAVFPLLYLYHETKEPKYLEGAKRLFDWGENFCCDDGSFYNGTHNSWAATTVFAALAIYDSLVHYGSLLGSAAYERWEQRLKRCCEWIYRTIDSKFQTNINYFCGTAAMMALAAGYFGRPEYERRADEMAGYCLNFFDEDLLLTGEGKPINGITAKGCRPVDIGYNVEESLGLLLIYARRRGNREMLKTIKASLISHLAFMLPDGGWDNSFGTRNFKWTYWGSRTSGGCQLAYGTWGEAEPAFGEAALQNILLMKTATHDGLLYGGPDYQVHGELPCVHHTFSHAVGLAAGLAAQASLPLAGPPPTADNSFKNRLGKSAGQGAKYYKSLASYQVRRGEFYATITGSDVEYIPGGHASGGTLTCLWHPQSGPVIVSAMTDYTMVEAHNMQLSRRKNRLGSLTPRAAVDIAGTSYAQCYDYQAQISCHDSQEETVIEVLAGLKDRFQHQHEQAGQCRLCYTITAGAIEIKGKFEHQVDCRPEYILPVIGRETAGFTIAGNQLELPKADGVLRICSDQLDPLIRPVFCLAGGFEAWECRFKPDYNGEFLINIYLNKEMG